MVSVWPLQETIMRCLCPDSTHTHTRNVSLSSTAVCSDPLAMSGSLLQRSHQSDIIATSIRTLWLTSQPLPTLHRLAVNRRNAKVSSSPISTGFSQNL